jgi:acetyltransferase-like isoleucine patch superfamily enzyme
MKDSGMRKNKILLGRTALMDFCRSDRRKVIIDIEGLTHNDVEKILYGNSFNALITMLRYMISAILYGLPFSGLKIIFYRICGVTIGKNVYFGPAVYLDMLKPSLISIGDNVMVGMKVNIMIHERTMKTLSIGRVRIGNGVTLGGAAIIRHAVTIGDNAEIDMLCSVRRSVRKNERVANLNCMSVKHD